MEKQNLIKIDLLKRLHDLDDINSPSIVNNLNWGLLDQIANDRDEDSSLNEKDYQEFLYNYRKYIKDNKK